MSADDLLYEPVKQRITAICGSCHKYFDYDINDPYPPYCMTCMAALGTSAGTEEMVEDSCCGSGECGCFFYMGWQAFAG